MKGARGDYLLTRQARIVAMTCSHAALTRMRLDLGFRYDMVMEGAAQVIALETLIPMLLQHHDGAAGPTEGGSSAGDIGARRTLTCLSPSAAHGHDRGSQPTPHPMM